MKKWRWTLRYTWFLWKSFSPLTIREAFECAEEEYVFLNTPDEG